MADIKISGLPASTTPLTGTEVLPVVQGTTTKQVSVANLTAGRTVSASSLVSTGVVSIGAAIGTEFLNILSNGRNVLQMSRASDNPVQNQFIFVKSRGSQAARTAIVTGDSIGDLLWQGFDGTNNVAAASISVNATGTISTGVVSGLMNFGAAISTGASVGFLQVNGGRFVRGLADDSSFIWDSAGSARLGFIKKAGVLPQIVSASAQPIIFGNSNNADLSTAVTGQTLTELARIHASGGVSIGNTTDPGAGNLSVTGTVRTRGYTVATLPAAGTAGRRAYVTDATLPTYLGALVGGGAVVCPVFDNGTAWVSA